MLITTEGLDGAGKSTVRDHLINYFESEKDGDLPVLTTTEPFDDEWLGKQVRRVISDDNAHPVEVFFKFMADHIYHYHNIVHPAEKEGKIVISDRYIDSRYAYQANSLREYIDGEPLQYLREFHESNWTVNSTDTSKKAISLAEQKIPDHISENTPRLGLYLYGLSENLELFSPEGIEHIKFIDPKEDFDGLQYTGTSPSWSKLPDHTLYIDVSVETCIERQSGSREIFEYKSFLQEVDKNYRSLYDQDPNRFIKIDGEQSKKDMVTEVTEKLEPLLTSTNEDQLNL